MNQVGLRKGGNLEMKKIMVIFLTFGLLLGISSIGLAQPEISVMTHELLRVNVYRKLLPEFERMMEEKETPVKVKLMVGPTPDTEFKEKLVMDLAVGAGPDVFMIKGTDYPDLIDAGYYLRLDEYFATWPDWILHFYSIPKEQVKYKGHWYVIPKEGNVMSLFYRKDILKKYGISTTQPKTFDELLDRAREIKRKTGKWALLYPAGKAWGGGTFAEGFILLMMGTEDPLYDWEAGKWVVKSPGLLQVFKFYETVTKEGLMPVNPLLVAEPWIPLKYQMFPQGNLIITTSGTWAWEFDWGPKGATPIPNLFEAVGSWMLPGVKKPYVLSRAGRCIGINAKTKHPRLAFELLKFILSAKFRAEECATVGAPAIRDDVKEYSIYGAKKYLVADEERLPFAKIFASPPGIDKIVTAVCEATEYIIIEKMTAEEALDYFERRATDLLGAEKVKRI